MEGWIDVWRSRPHWAQAFDHRHDSLLEVSASAFLPNSFDQPASSWSDFEVDVRRALGRDRDEYASPFIAGSIIAAIASHEFAPLRRKIRAAMQIQPLHVRLDDFDVKCVAQPEPVWIPNRIACMAFAVEFVRLLDDRPPLFARIRPLMDSAECVWKLRSRTLQSHE
jgi:hypothetical protein